MANEEDMKKWNVPSAIAFGLSLAAVVALCALGHLKEAGLVLLIAGGIAVPQPLRGDK